MSGAGLGPHGITDLHERRQCTAHSRSGNRCGQTPIPGGTVCKWHGGAIPAVRSKAQERLLAAVDPAITELLRIMRHGDTDTVRLRAVEAILDRTGNPRFMALGESSAEDAGRMIAERLADIAALRGES